ncbi:four helix bundle protein [Achromobacter sp. AONIH1]|uniref:four helix bundle protein n=1 Tax=Achromobacter sp. AONIH1 TaxID=1758194 RepID=UPI000CD22ADA|nr:four helix bundle protein [Achromobacter sp. AONIH1]AUT46979.1 four helix bundle protein [Achromobacter sp. AONIH1]
MALHTDTKIFKVTYDLSLLVTKFVANMPRNYKADFGADLRKQCFELVALVYRANSASDRPPVIRILRERVVAVDLSLRLATDLRLISRGQYGEAIALTDSIGRQATGWLKHSENALAAPSSRRQGQCA